jgi:hypothetical protein
MYVPIVEEVNLHDEEAMLPRGRKTVVGLQDTISPEVDTEDATFTKPEKPPRLTKSREVVAEDPAANTREVGVAETPKSTTFIEMTALCETEPLVPVTVIV